MFKRNKRNFTNNAPRWILAKFDSFCSDTGKAIPKGTACLYIPSKQQVFSEGSPTESYFKMLRQDEEFFGKSYYFKQS